jgi:hypothetical protein
MGAPGAVSRTPSTRSTGPSRPPAPARLVPMAGRPHLETHEARLVHGLFDTPDTSVFLTKRTFFLPKRTFFLTKRTFFLPKRTLFLTKRTFFLPKRTLFLARGFSLHVEKSSF